MLAQAWVNGLWRTRAAPATFFLRGNLCFAILPLLILLGCARDTGEKEPRSRYRWLRSKRKRSSTRSPPRPFFFLCSRRPSPPRSARRSKTFYVKRGSRVHKGQLLAVLENRDLAAAAQENKGSYDQAQAAYATTTASDLPQEVQKAQLDAQAAKELFDAQQKIYSSRQELFQQGAMPRKELDQAGVDLTNARNQYEIAQKHLDALTGGRESNRH